MAFHQKGPQVVVVAAENENWKVKILVAVVVGVGGGEKWWCLSSVCCFANLIVPFKLGREGFNFKLYFYIFFSSIFIIEMIHECLFEWCE